MEWESPRPFDCRCSRQSVAYVTVSLSLLVLWHMARVGHFEHVLRWIRGLGSFMLMQSTFFCVCVLCFDNEYLRNENVRLTVLFSVKI